MPSRVSPTISAGGHRVTPDAALPLVSAALRVDASGGIARVVCEQRFINRSREPLSTIYSLPLPADSAVAGFSFLMADRRIVGEIDRKAAARERFEEALIDGRTAALLEQDRSSLFTQELANIPPGAEIVAEVTLDQRLVWLDEGSWEWRFPTTVLPRYLGEPGGVPDALAISQLIADQAMSPRVQLTMTIGDRLAEKGAPHSPAHALRIDAQGRTFGVGLAADGGVPLDRDVVVRWPVAQSRVGTALETARPSQGSPLASAAYGLLTLAPPEQGARAEALPRDLIVLVDTSGSMAGRPLEQARRVVMAIVASLGDADSLELIEFSEAPRRWRAEPVRASQSAKREALDWLKSRRAGGGTEMRDGILEALRPARAGSQRQVVLVTDGAIGFESEVVTAICKTLPDSCRLHTVGVGSAVNRSITAVAARAGRGIEIVVGLDEDAEPAAARLVRATAAPLVVALEIGGSALVSSAPARLRDLFAGAPALVGLELRAEGGELWVRGQGARGPWEQAIHVSATGPAQGNARVVSLFGRERVEDLEMLLAAGPKEGEAEDLRQQIERAGLDFAIATHFTSWVAVTEEQTVDPQAPTRHVRVPHELPYGTSIDGLGLRSPWMEPMMTLGAARPRAILAASPHLRRTTLTHARLPSAPAGRSASIAQDGSDPDFGHRTLGPGANRDEPTPEGKVRIGGIPAEYLPRKLRGLVIARQDGELVVRVDLTNDLSWSPPQSVEVVHVVRKDERSRIVTEVAEVVSERTTRAGTLTAGHSLRIAIRFPSAESSAPVGLRLNVDGQELFIDFRS